MHILSNNTFFVTFDCFLLISINMMNILEKFIFVKEIEIQN